MKFKNPLIIDPEIIEAFDSQVYAQKNQEEKDNLKNLFFSDDNVMSNKVKGITLLASQRKDEISDFLFDISRDERFMSLDVVETNPELQDMYIDFTGIMKNIEEYTVQEAKKGTNIDEKFANKACVSLFSATLMGVIDTDKQKHMLGISVYNFEMSLSSKLRELGKSDEEVKNVLNTFNSELFNMDEAREDVLFRKTDKITDRLIKDSDYAAQFSPQMLDRFKIEMMAMSESDFSKKVKSSLKQDVSNIFVRKMMDSERFLIKFDKMKEDKLKRKSLSM